VAIRIAVALEPSRRATETAKADGEGTLRGLTSGTADTYETYRSLYQIWQFHNSSVPELRPLFNIPGVEPDGRLSVTEDFKKQVLSTATAILANLQD